MADLDRIYQDARDLITEPGDENPEYDRGVAELLATIDPRREVPLADRAQAILQYLRR